jgi:hypothetical protein
VAKSDLTGMPWSAIFKRTAQAAAVTLVGFTALCAADLQRQRREKEESERFRWTDKNRWE